jgi:hypothetical protein
LYEPSLCRIVEGGRFPVLVKTATLSASSKFSAIIFQSMQMSLIGLKDCLNRQIRQKILRLVVGRVEFVEDQITIKHVIPVSDVRLRRNRRGAETPNCGSELVRGSA